MEADDDVDDPKRYPEASRRTYFAHERTLLAWWRTGIATAAVALGVGALLPKVSTGSRDRFLALGAGYGVLALMFVMVGAIREQRSREALANNSHAELSGRLVLVMTVYLSVLIVLTVVAIF